MNPTPEELGYIEAELALLSPAEGGRSVPIRTGYRPNWWLLASSSRENAGGSVELVDRDELAPGATARIRIYPFVWDSWDRASVGSRLEASEGPTLIGRAVVTRVVPALATAKRA